MSVDDIYQALIELQRIRREAQDPSLHWREREAAMEHFDASFNFLVAEIRDSVQSKNN